MLAPNNNRGMTYQTNQKNKTNLREYFVGVVKLAIYCEDNCFYVSFPIISLIIYQIRHRKNS